MASSDASQDINLAPRTGQRRRYRPRLRVTDDAALYDEEVPLHHTPERSRAEEGGFRVLLIFVAVVLALLFYAVLSSRVNLGSYLSAFSVRFLSIFIEAAPFLLLGTIVSGLIEVFVSREHIARLVPRNALGGAVMGTFLGVAFPVCECGVVPVVRQLYQKSLPVSVGIAFLLAAPVMNPIVLFSTLTAFGPGPVVWWRFIITAVVAISVSLLFAFIAKRDNILRAQPLAPPAHLPLMGSAHIPPAREAVAPRVRRALGIGSDEFFEMGRYLVIGCLLAATAQTLVPQETLLALGQGPVVSVLTMQLLAFVLSVCSTVDAFIALAFTQTFATGSILAFLTFGPMVDVKSTLMFLGVFRRWVVALLIGLPFILTGLIAVLMNLLSLP